MSVIQMSFADRDATDAWPDLTDAWPDLAEKAAAGLVTHVEGLQVSVYPDATASGAPTACFRFDLAEGGGVIIAQVTIRNLLQMQASIAGRLAYLQIDENGKSTACPDTERN